MNTNWLIAANLSIGAVFGLLLESIFWGLVLALVPMPLNVLIGLGALVVHLT